LKRVYLSYRSLEDWTVWFDILCCNAISVEASQRLPNPQYGLTT